MIALVGASIFGFASSMAQAQTESAATAKPSANDDAGGVAEIIVTAQKREQSVNTVPMSITAASGEQLEKQGIKEVRDLVRIVPGFNYSESNTASPIYTLRGVGYGDVSIGGRPTVSVYADEAPIPFAIETKGTSLDLERVEVLKGPQGTLFGQNATGGAINFIAAKPTESLSAGMNASYGRFNSLDVGGFVSGPLSDTLLIRIAGQHRSSSDWQRSFTRNESRGAENFNNGRLSLDWNPDSAVRAQLTVSGWLDRSDTQAIQLVQFKPQVPFSPNGVSIPPLIPGFLTTPAAPANARAADWTPGLDLSRDNSFVQTNLRLDVDLSEALTLTSLSSYSKYKGDEFNDLDGSVLRNIDVHRFGDIETFYQELRIASDLGGHGNAVLGATYEWDKSLESDNVNLGDATQGWFVVPIGLPVFRTLHNEDNQRSTTWAVFGNVEYQLTPTVTVSGGIRYTKFRDKFDGASYDAGDGNISSVFTPLYNLIRAGAKLPPLPPIPRGGSATLNDNLVPEVVRTTLREDNVSWRVNVQWKPADHTLLYANVSKGYKAGSFPITGATRTSIFQPATQESVLAYEVGFKASVLDRMLQLNGAVFYYDYRDKQIQGRIIDQFLGGLFRLTNIPKSEIKGAEIQAVFSPVKGLVASAGLSYIDSKIKNGFTNYDPFNNLTNFEGQSFPNTPKWQFASDIEYKFPVNDNFDAFVGGGVTHQSATNSALGQQPLLAVKAYTLVDLRAGLDTSDGRWRATIWGRNVGNEYYWVSASYIDDAIGRSAGRPVSYGVSLSYRFD